MQGSTPTRQHTEPHSQLQDQTFNKPSLKTQKFNLDKEMQTYIASSFAFGIKVSWKKNGARRTRHELQIISKYQMQSGENMRRR